VATKEAIKQAIRDQYQRDLPFMNVENVKMVVLDWLAEVKFPDYLKAESWSDCIKTFRVDPEERKLDSGIRVRLVLPLYTRENRYMISLTEDLNPHSREIYTLCLYVNWKDDELQMQKTVEDAYSGGFIDTLKARNVLWAQTFKLQDLREALNCCAVAIMGHELVGKPPKTEMKVEPLGPIRPTKTSFPAPDED